MLTRNDLMKDLTNAMNTLTTDEYFVSEAYTSNGFPYFVLSNGVNTVNLHVNIENRVDYSTPVKVTIQLSKGEDVSVLRTYYRSPSRSREFYSESFDEISRALQTRRERINASLIKTEKDITSDNMIAAAKKLKGFRSVPKKNIRVTKRFNTYTIENTASRTIKKLELN